MTKTGALCLFDMDGTLTKPRNVADQDMIKCMRALREVCDVGIVSGSDLPKINQQLGMDPCDLCDYVFPENGILAFKGKEKVGSNSIKEYLGEDKLQDLINFVLEYFSTLRLPCKRGTFVEYRTGMLNFCPVGRACSQAERDNFEVHDKEHKIREKFVKAAKEKFDSYDLSFAIGGQISVDCFPKGWDKRACLQYVEEQYKGKIHFYGDRTSPGGNDYEIFADDRVFGHTVVSPADTQEQLKKEFGISW